jgi:amidase
MGKSVRDVAELFSAMIGSDPADPATKDSDAHKHDYAAALKLGTLRGMRIGVIRPDMPPDLAVRYNAALAILNAMGATLVDVNQPELKGVPEAEHTVLSTEFKADLNAYLATTPATVKTHTLADVIAFDDAHKADEMPYFGQELLLAAEKTKGLNDPVYEAARAKSLELAGKQGIDAMLKTANANMLVEPTSGPAWLSDPIYGDHPNGPSSSMLPAVSGDPNLTVPMGLVDGLPSGLSFIGPAYSEQRLLDVGYDYEQASHARVAPKYLSSADVRPGLNGAGE